MKNLFFIQNFQSHSKKLRPWVYFALLAINILIISEIIFVYIRYDKNNEIKLSSEHINNVKSLNEASASAIYTYTNDMIAKINDTVNVIKQNKLNVDETIRYLDISNTNCNRQFQLIHCGDYGPNNEIFFGDYEGISIRKEENDTKDELITHINNISYTNGYYKILRSFTDVFDNNYHNSCFTSEFINSDTKKNCFGIYKHIPLVNSDGEKKLYVLFLIMNSQTALNLSNRQTKYEGQATVLINSEGEYIIKNSDYRNANFYDYIVNYNDLPLDMKAKLRMQVYESTLGDKNTIELYYKNHQGKDCVFSIIRMENSWYNITCVPLSSFNYENLDTNYSLILVILFMLMFTLDGIVVFFVGKILNFNIKIAESATSLANQASMAKSQFLSTMSHELRTPLNTIIGFASLANDDENSQSQIKDYLKKIRISSKLLLQLINDILDISAIEAGKLKLNISKFNIAKLVTSLSTIYCEQCSNKQIDYDVILKDIHSEIFLGDFSRINQILLNFLSNAVKFTPSGGKISLFIEEKQRDEKTSIMKFSVTDTGCGVSSELKERIFKPFERATGYNARKYSGTGLGLSIAKRISELMGGSVGMESTVGVGSTFWAEIPLEIVERKTKQTINPIAGLHAVIAVNNDDERNYFSQMLTNFGIEHASTTDITNAIAILDEEKNSENPFNLCIIDYKLMDFIADDGVRKIRESYSKDKLKIIVLSYDLAKTEKVCLDAGANYVFCKPIFSSVLYNLLNNVIDNNFVFDREVHKDYDLNGKRILLVEDNKINIEYVKIVLDKFNVEAEVAENGKIAYEKFTLSPSGYFDLILMDVQMPEMNGYESTSLIRKSSHKDANTIPIVAMTADAFAEDIERAIESGMNEHVSKPIEPDTLYSVLKKYFG